MLSRRSRNLVAVAVVFSAGCSMTISAGEECVHPPDECETTGLFTGQCSGSEGPVLACGDTGSCRWYSGGCPTGLHRSLCPDEDICCHDRAGGTWPFEEWHPPSERERVSAQADISAMRGLSTRLGEPGEVSAAIEPGLVAPDATAIRCSEGNPLTELCSGTPSTGSGVARVIGNSTVVQFDTTELAGQSLLLEVIPGDVVSARLFVRPRTDGVESGYIPVCTPAQDAPFLSGRLRLTGLGQVAHGVLRAEQVGGQWVEADF